MNTNPQVDQYLTEGCGRCPLGGTPDCKIHDWIEELKLLRELMRDTGLTEERKWGVPCYTWEGKNVLLITALREYCAISFFKGALLEDAGNLLVKPGENSQAARLFKFTEPRQIIEIAEDIRFYIREAIEIEKSGRKIDFRQQPEPIPKELEEKFEEDPVLKSAFEALTPGRQRGYILFFSAPSQSKTRSSRIEKNISKILKGEGLHEKYRKRKS